MEDKDLFEKVEIEFNLKNSSKIERIFESGKFKKSLNEVVEPSDGSGLLGAIGSAVKYLSPTQARKRRAEARALEIQNARTMLKLMKGELDSTDKSSFLQNASDIFKKRYNEDGRFKTLQDSILAGKYQDLSSADKEYYQTTLNDIYEAEKQADEKAKEIEAKKAEVEEEKQLRRFIDVTLRERIPQSESEKERDINPYEDLKKNISDFGPKMIDLFALMHVNYDKFAKNRLKKKGEKSEFISKIAYAIAKTSLEQAGIEPAKARNYSVDTIDDKIAIARDIFIDKIIDASLPVDLEPRLKNTFNAYVDEYFDKIMLEADPEKLELGGAEGE